jgi:hypothetical protein
VHPVNGANEVDTLCKQLVRHHWKPNCLAEWLKGLYTSQKRAGEQCGWMKRRNGFCNDLCLANTLFHKWSQRIVVVPLASLSSLCVAHQK